MSDPTLAPLALPLLVEATQLLPVLAHPQLRLIDLSRAAVFAQVHLPRAISVAPSELVQHVGNATGMLPELSQLQALLQRLAISPTHHVVVYDDEGGGWAGRFIWTLHCLGYHKVSLLNGGIHAWLAHGFVTSSDVVEPEPLHQSQLENITLQPDYRIDLNEIQQGLAASEQPFTLWDCRSFEEFTGTRLAARRGGHIPHAFHLDWLQTFERSNDMRLKPLAEIQSQLVQRGLDTQKPVVVYCQSHHRSGLTYVIARLLNLNVRAYDGAWSEWANHRDTPIMTGE